MYSLIPLENVTFDPHIGFWLSVIVFVLFIGTGIVQKSLDFVSFLVASIMLTVVGIVSFAEPVVHPNTLITGEFIRYSPEEHSYRCGKNSTCYTSRMFAEFKVPEGIVILQVNPAYPMPKFVKMYKN
jgi:hypothetical protein